LYNKNNKPYTVIQNAQYLIWYTYFIYSTLEIVIQNAHCCYLCVVSNAEKPTNRVKKTIFEITKMDCPSEENLIRMKLDGISSIANLDFDIPNRKLTVFHSGEIDQIEKSVIELNLGGKKKTKKSYFGLYLQSILHFLLSK